MNKRLQTIELGLILALLFLLPAVFDVSVFQAFVLPKKILFDLLGGSVILIWAIRMFYEGRIAWPSDRRFAALVFFWLLMTLVAVAFSDLPSQAWFGGALRSFGSQSQLLLFLIFLWAVANYELIRDRIRILTATAAASGSLVSFYGLVQVAGLDPLQWGTGERLIRAHSTLGQPNFLASFLLPVSYLTFYGLLKAEKFRLSYTVALLTELSALAFSLSRGAWLGLAASGSLFLLARIYKKNKTYFKIAVAAMSLFLVAWLAVGLSGHFKTEDYDGRNELLKRVVSFADFSQVSLRGYYYEAAWSLIKQRPFTGYGADTLGYYFYPYYNGNWSMFEVINQSTDKAHNFWLDSMLETGVFGLVWWLLLIGLAAYLLFRQKRMQPLAYFSGGACLAILISWQLSFATLEPALWFWLLSGVFFGEALKEKKTVELKPWIFASAIVAVAVFAMTSLMHDANAYVAGRTYRKLLVASNIDSDATVGYAKKLLNQASAIDLRSFYAAKIYDSIGEQMNRRKISQADLRYCLNKLESTDTLPHTFDYKSNRLQFLASMSSSGLEGKRGALLAAQLDKEYAELKKTAAGYASLEMYWGNLAFYKNAYPDALSHYQTALTLYPDISDRRMNDEHRLLVAREKALVYYRLAWYYKTVGQWKDALGSIDEALALDKTDSYASLQKEIKAKVK